MAGVRSNSSDGSLDSAGNVCYNVNVQVNDQHVVSRSTLCRLLTESMVISASMVVRLGKSPDLHISRVPFSGGIAARVKQSIDKEVEHEKP